MKRKLKQVNKIPESEEEPLNNDVTPQMLYARGVEEAIEQFIKQEREMNPSIIITDSWCFPYANTLIGTTYDSIFPDDDTRERPTISVTWDASSGRVNINPTNKTAEILFETVGSNPSVLGNAETL